MVAPMKSGLDGDHACWHVSHGGVCCGQIQGDRAGEEFIVWKRMRSEFPADTPAEREPR